ncbi:hypothetical protein PACTADRAFT_48855 [Pachysolen tannophilus NRRL Y-2460]|uniref:E3 ubiquitin protein ligase n=1 Tax=Pachysolen tannophilus NRRL Y-2460 TaxID=669874 RepID=A0A1E4TZD4_PACTA|nr:hypothetical protein PACTADRAFT_48855 [Pachysolen tannophilus NRRL Y-2460]
MTDDEKKRSAGEELNGISKRRVLDTLSEDGPLTQEDVVYFQKEAIFRQMKKYKKECKLLSMELTNYKTRFMANQKKISVLDGWYKQIIDDLNNKVSSSNESPTTALNQKLLVRLPEDDGDELLELLQKRRDALLEFLSRYDIGNNGSNSTTTSATANIDSDDLNAKVQDLNYQLMEIKSENDTLVRSKNLLEENLRNFQDEIYLLTKESERANSKTLKRISEINNDDDKELSHDSDRINGKDATSQQVKIESSTPDLKKENTDDLVNKEELEKLTVEFEELKALNQDLTRKLNEELSLSAKLKKDSMEASLKLQNLTEVDLHNCIPFQNALKSKDILKEELDDYKLKDKQLFARISDLETERSKFRNSVEELLKKEYEELRKNLKKSEQDLVRIRTARDDLISKNTILKSAQPNQELIEEFKSLIDVQKKKIENLESGVTVKEFSEVDQNADRESLLKQNAALLNELKELENAFKNVHDISVKKLGQYADSDSVISKLTVEKNKADQKYFSAMRVKDSLSQENKALKSTLNKQSELIGTLKEVEKNYLLKCETLESNLKDLKYLENNLSNENRELKKSLRELSNSYELLKRNNEKLVATSTSSLSKQELELNLRKQKESELVKLQSRYKSIETLLDKYKSANANKFMLEEEEKNIEIFRKIAKCPVCSKNWKNTAIKVCGHVFCNECAHERLAARLRRCPSCNKQFSVNDLLTIHL